ncbi:MAG: ABC transporter ATP-binding protein/permease [Gammaproteobacteria bacterium]
MSRQLEARPYTAWQLIRAYWLSEERFSAYLLFIGLLLMGMALVGLEVLLTTWYNIFYNALQEYKVGQVLDLLWVFVFIATIHVILIVYNYYMQSVLGLRWRRWLTKQFLTLWLSNRAYYYLENFDKHTDNPDQRIQEDIASLASYSLDLVTGLFTSVVTIAAFIYILWKLSGIITIPLGRFGELHVPGYMVWVSIIYASIGSYFTFKIGRPLIKLNFEQQHREANFRYGAVDLRTHSENVALYRGEDHQNGVLTRMLYSLLDNWYMIILRQKLLLWFTGTYNQVSVLVPLAVALPNYFNKVFELGGLMQSMAAFDRIQGALSFLVNSYTRIAEWRAITQRLITFLNHIDDIEKEVESRDHFSIKQLSQDKIVAQNIQIQTPEGNGLLKNITTEFLQGKSYWLSGHSGIGKSTFVRAIAGIWPYGSGQITLPNSKNIMFVPQKFYMPLGTLKEALLFPDRIKTDDEELVRLLKACDLPELTSQLHVTHKWSEMLSPGELQRIAFVRVMLQKPDYVFLDESTSALDIENEKLLYTLLKKQLPGCSVISVGHRPSLAEYHDHHIDMTQYEVDRVPA